MSQAHDGEPLRRHWLYIPLVAFLVFAVGPSVLAPIFFILSLFVDISSIIGPAQHAPGIGSILLEPIFLGLIFWPFLWLYGFARDALIEDPSSEKSLRLATIMSVIAMSVPCSLFLVATPGEMMLSGVGQGTGFVAFSSSYSCHFQESWDGLLAAGSRGCCGPDPLRPVHRRLRDGSPSEPCSQPPITQVSI